MGCVCCKEARKVQLRWRDDMEKTSIKLQAKNCFVCGYDNPHGLRLPFYYDGDTVCGTFTPERWTSGFEEVVHGGILFAVADEAMMHLLCAAGIRAISAEVTIRFHNYARTGGELKIKAELIEKSEHLIKAKCYLTNIKGDRIATASGKFLPFSEKDFKDFEKVF